MKWTEVGRYCSVCNQFKSWDNFSWKRTKRHKNKEPKLHQIKQPKCKSCAHNETKRWRENQSQDRLKDLYYTRTYGLTLKEFNQMFIKQDGKCLLCKTELELDGLSRNRAVVDHCHTGGHVRGILCNECNRGLGYFKDNRNTLMNAIRYLAGEDLTSEEGGSSCLL